jgi:uncharacterized membrane protein YbaN (DUF454 family)
VKLIDSGLWRIVMQEQPAEQITPAQGISGITEAQGVTGICAAPLPDRSLSLALPSTVTGLRRVVFVFLGLFFVFLGAVGVVTPVLPTTPFLLLASYFFVRSSPRLNAWLLRSRVFGPLICDWQRHRAVRRKVKVTALILVPLVIASSAYFGDLPWYLVVMLISLGAIGLTVVIRLPVIRDEPAKAPAAAQPAPGEAV